MYIIRTVIFFIQILKTGKTKKITETTDTESNPQFSFNETKIVYNRNQNLYAWDITTGETQQLTNLKSGSSGCIMQPVPPVAGTAISSESR